MIIIIGMVIVTLVTSPPDYSKISLHLESSNSCRRMTKVCRGPWYKQVKFWYGVMAAVWFSIYWYFW